MKAVLVGALVVLIPLTAVLLNRYDQEQAAQAVVIVGFLLAVYALTRFIVHEVRAEKAKKRGGTEGGKG
jgi:prolipoprotein diacylglyceryltransferase